MDEPAGAIVTATTTESDPGSPRPTLGVGPRVWRTYVTEVREDADDHALRYRSSVPGGRVAAETAIVLVTAAVCLTLANFLADGREPGWLATILRAVGLDGLANDLETAMRSSDRREFYRLLWWSLAQIASYVVLPVLVIWIALRGRLRDYGCRVRGIGTHVGPYAVIGAVAIPFVVAASFTSGFQAKYPFYDLAAGEGLWPYVWWWWALYALQFAALEFFFRGFLVLGLAPRLGYAAVLVMLVPYNMIHYGKPMLEALAAIVGGFVLGSLALRTRSIWWGVAVHVTIAATMDVLALTHAGVLF